MIKRIRTLLGLCTHEWVEDKPLYKKDQKIGVDYIVGIADKKDWGYRFVLYNIQHPSPFGKVIDQTIKTRCKHCGRMKKYTF